MFINIYKSHFNLKRDKSKQFYMQVYLSSIFEKYHKLKYSVLYRTWESPSYKMQGRYVKHMGDIGQHKLKQSQRILCNVNILTLFAVFETL